MSPAPSPFTDGERAYVIAEVGSNHDGDLKRALDLIRLAAEAGADAAKFQMFRAQTLVLPGAPAHDTLDRLALPAEWLPSLRDACREHGLAFAAAPFDLEAVDALVGAGGDWIKIASSDVTFLALLERSGATGLPVVLSTGMSTVAESAWAVERLQAAGCGPLAVLHCVSKYPPAFADMNLSVIPVLARELGCVVGLSDHTPGISAPLAAYALGARVFEKHLTDDRSRQGPDHPYALEPTELAELVAGLRNLQDALGDGVKRPMAEETQIMVKARRGLYAARPLEAGTRLQAEDVVALRPTAAVNAEDLPRVVGTQLKSALDALAPLPASLLEGGA